jgi:hypothetical protein
MKAILTNWELHFYQTKKLRYKMLQIRNTYMSYVVLLKFNKIVKT